MRAGPGGGFVVGGAVVQGTLHLASGQGCQDAFKAAFTDTADAVVLAVADGAGSRDRSSLGAHIAVDTACRLLCQDLPRTADGVRGGAAAWPAWISERARRVADSCQQAAEALLGAGAAAVDEASPPDSGALSATLAAAVFQPPWAAFLSVGDCTATVLTREPDGSERCHLVLPPPGAGDPPPAFLYSPAARLRMRSFALWDPHLAGVALATDGCTPMILDHPGVRGLPPEAGPLPSPRFFRGLSSTLRKNGGDAEPLRALLSGPEAARSGDDLTVLCALDGSA